MMAMNVNGALYYVYAVRIHRFLGNKKRFVLGDEEFRLTKARTMANEYLLC